MVMQKRKHSGKRITLKRKSKVLKKVKEHHEKKAKEAKKLGFNKKPAKVVKDLDAPRDWPVKEQELKAPKEPQARAIEGSEPKKAVQRDSGQKRKLELMVSDDAGVASQNKKKFREGKGTDDSIGVGKIRDNSERAFYKELTKVIEASDVILEVLDARDPLGTRCVDMEKMVLKSGPDKHLVLLLNKIDLAPREAVEKWLKYLREELPAVAFKCSTQEQRSNLGWKSTSKKAKPSSLLQTSDCLGAETLLKLLKNYSRSHEIKKSITVGVIGLPNVGKSSLINSLKRCHVANVGATPGLTRSLQEVQLDKNVKLLDCPGVVMLRSGPNDASIALRNCKRIEKLDDPVAPVKEILKLCTAELLVKLFKIPAFESVDDFLFNVATVRGRLKKGGIVDIDAAARIVLHDWNEGKIPYYTMPPVRNQDEPSKARIVSELGKEFNIDEVYNGEMSFIGSLKSVDDLEPVEVPPSCPVKFDDDMQEKEEQPVGHKSQEDMPGDGDEVMGEETEEADKVMPKTINGRQNEKLYTSQWILNPKLKKAKKKAEKKRRKNEKSALTSGDAMDNDAYDLKEDHSAKDTAMEASNEETKEDAPEKLTIGKVPMANVNFDLLDQ